MLVDAGLGNLEQIVIFVLYVREQEYIHACESSRGKKRPHGKRDQLSNYKLKTEEQVLF